MQIVLQEAFRSDRPSRSVGVSHQLLCLAVAVLDVGILGLSSVAGLYVCRWIPGIANTSLDRSIAVNMIAFAIFVVLSRAFGLYKSQVIFSPVPHISMIVRTLAVSLLVPICVFIIFETGTDYPRDAIVINAVLANLFLPGGRLIIGAGARLAGSRGLVRGRSAVMIGDSREMDELNASDMRRFGVEVIARFAIPCGLDVDVRGDLFRGQIAGAINAARKLRASEFAIALPWSQERYLNEVRTHLRLSPLPVRLYPDRQIRAIMAQQQERVLDPHFAVTIQREPLSGSERAVKRLIDILVAASALLALSPLFLFTALAIKLDSAGPVIFRQRRCGFDGRVFVILKFRTMSVMENGDRIVQVSRDDPRVTRAGRFLRRFSIDELPQLLNVLSGEMSIVGPRPHAIAQDDEYKPRIADYARRHHVKPGLTGAAQVVGLRGETSEIELMVRRVERDLWYINNWSVTLDLKLMLQTIWALSVHTGY